MELVGVSKLNADYEAAMAVRKGIKLFIDESSKENFKKAGIEVAGTKVEMINDSQIVICLLYTSPSPPDRTRSRMPSSA